MSGSVSWMTRFPLCGFTWYDQVSVGKPVAVELMRYADQVGQASPPSICSSDRVPGLDSWLKSAALHQNVTVVRARVESER